MKEFRVVEDIEIGKENDNDDWYRKLVSVGDDDDNGEGSEGLGSYDEKYQTNIVSTIKQVTNTFNKTNEGGVHKDKNEADKVNA